MTILGTSDKQPSQALATANGDGLAVYSPSAGNLQWRQFTNSSSSWGAASDAVTGTAISTQVRTSPIRQEAVAGFVNSSGTLTIACFNGTSWSTDFTATVGGNGTTRRFDIAYEQTSGDVMVMYSTNTATTNELQYRTKAGTKNCGSGNWSGATNFDPIRTNNVVYWVKLIWDKRSGTNRIGAAWDSRQAASSPWTTYVSAAIWNGTSWESEPSTALETKLDNITTGNDVDAFDIEFETTTGDLMAVTSWWDGDGATNTNGMFYTTCTGAAADGSNACSWTVRTAMPTLLDDGSNLDISANPTNDDIVFGSIGETQSDLSLGYWNGTSWTNTANVDTTSRPLTTSYTHYVTTGWLINGSYSRMVVVYADASSTNVNYYTGDGNSFAGFTVQTDDTPSPAMGTPSAYDIQMNPYNNSEFMLHINDVKNDLWSKKLTLSGAGALTWADTEGGSALEASLASTADNAFSAAFAYWNSPPTTYVQTGYRWYANANSTTPGSALAAQNTQAASTSSQVRLRICAQVQDSIMAEASQRFKLEVSTDQATWNTVGAGGGGGWWDNSWTKRRKITFNNSSSTTNLTDFPVMVQLSSSNIDYANTQNSGQDLRFVDADGTTVLNYEIEKWNEAGTSSVWVKVPQIDASSSTDYMYMYYGNVGAADGQNGTGTWNSNYKAVQHFEEASGTFTDSTSNANNGTGQNSPTYGTAGKDGNGVTLGGAGYSQISATGDSGLPHRAAFTSEFWLKPSANYSTWDKFLYDDHLTSPTPSWDISTGGTGTNRVNAELGVTDVITDATVLTNNAWNHVAVTHDGTTVKIYINGALSKSGAVGYGSGSQAGYTISDNAISTVYDEVRIATGARTADWIGANYKSVNNTLNTFDVEETPPPPTGVWTFTDNAAIASGAAITSLLSATGQSYEEQATTTSNLVYVAKNGYAEYDFALDGAAVANGTYYFRLVNEDGSTLSSYTTYPTITLRPDLSINSYRTFDDTTTGSVSTAKAAVNTAALIAASEKFRVRMSIRASNRDYGVGASEPSFKLQFAARSGTCDTAYSDESYADVTTATAIAYSTTSPTDGTTAVTNATLDPGTNTPQYVEKANPTTTRASYTAGNNGLWDYALVNSSASASAYCFRTVLNDGSLMGTPTVVPEILTNQPPNAPTSLTQSSATNGTLSSGAWSRSTTITFSANATDPDATDTLYLCVEKKPLNTALTGTADGCSGSGTAYSGSAVSVTHSITVSDATQYHWGAYVKDAANATSAWAYYGTNNATVADFGVDATAPTGGTVYDGSTPAVDAGFNDGSLDALSANWSGFNANVSGLSGYEYSIGTTAGGTTIAGWTSTGTTASMTRTGLTLATGQLYYVNVRATDAAGNVTTAVSSNGQMVAPTINFALGASSVTFANLSSLNSYTDTETLTLTTSTNAKAGFQTYGRTTTQPTGPSTIAAWTGTWAAPSTWSSGTGFGYTSSDTLVSGSNRFSSGTKYAGFLTSSPGDIVSDAGGAVTNQVDTLTLKVATNSTKTAGNYASSLLFTCVANY